MTGATPCVDYIDNKQVWSSNENEAWKVTAVEEWVTEHKEERFMSTTLCNRFLSSTLCDDTGWH